MAKKVFYDEDARNRILGGAKLLYDAVKVTYGPKGRNVVIAKGYGGPTVTHDGVTVAESVDLPEDEQEAKPKIAATVGTYQTGYMTEQERQDFLDARRNNIPQ